MMKFAVEEKKRGNFILKRALAFKQLSSSVCVQLNPSRLFFKPSLIWVELLHVEERK